MERIRERSWFGSEDNRKEQLICLPPKRPPNKTQKYTIPVGSDCRIRHISSGKSEDWRKHETKRELGYERAERVGQLFYEFREGGYFIRIDKRLVKVV